MRMLWRHRTFVGRWRFRRAVLRLPGTAPVPHLQSLRKALPVPTRNAGSRCAVRRAVVDRHSRVGDAGRADQDIPTRTIARTSGVTTPARYRRRQDCPSSDDVDSEDRAAMRSKSSCRSPLTSRRCWACRSRYPTRTIARTSGVTTPAHYRRRQDRPPCPTCCDIGNSSRAALPVALQPLYSRTLSR